jgi:hypothetical protein
MTCSCVKQVNEKLAENNVRLAVGLAVTKDLGVITRLLIRTEKKDRNKRTKPLNVSATFCPFCGVKFDGCAMAEPKEAPHG